LYYLIIMNWFNLYYLIIMNWFTSNKEVVLDEMPQTQPLVDNTTPTNTHFIRTLLLNMLRNDAFKKHLTNEITRYLRGCKSGYMQSLQNTGYSAAISSVLNIILTKCENPNVKNFTAITIANKVLPTYIHDGVNAFIQSDATDIDFINIISVFNPDLRENLTNTMKTINDNESLIMDVWNLISCAKWNAFEAVTPEELIPLNKIITDYVQNTCQMKGGSKSRKQRMSILKKKTRRRKRN
jgi:hypothetical protein